MAAEAMDIVGGGGDYLTWGDYGEINKLSPPFRGQWYWVLIKCILIILSISGVTGRIEDWHVK